MRSTKIKIGVACAAASLLALTLTTVAIGAGTAPPVGSGTASATHAICGMGTGKKATGTPIKLGGIDMLIPGVDFTTIGKVANAYFDCVNDNGGINGRPISYTLLTEALNPAQETADAQKLIQGDKVVGIVGNTSFAECGTNWRYYKSKGFVVIGAGVQAECYSTPSFAEVNSGPRYSDVGAVQALIKAGAKKLAFASPSTISAYADGGPALVAQKAGIPYKIFPTTLPVTDATSQLLQMYQFVGNGGGILLDFTPDTAPAFMKAAEAQGIVDNVLWGSSTPIANTLMASQFSPTFDGHLWIDNEFSNVDPSVGPDSALMFQVLKKYAPSIAPQAFAQMGYLDGEFATHALLSIKGPVTAKSYNTAVKLLKNQKTDILCKPFYVGGLPYHIPNNTNEIVDYQAGKVVVREPCTDFEAVDPAITQTRIWEKKYNYNTGK
ncbi:MAG TPA: ABC transporter substrate-binding protein [Gaiellaceae bacterium]|nr:ABC transporter substrate-binding protein [Gaiellaceae bacterium]